jgi:hypothetical protein
MGVQLFLGGNMSSSKLMNLSGLAGVVGGAIIIGISLITLIGHLTLSDPSRYIDVWGLPIYLLGFLLVLLTLIGIYSSQSSKLGNLGFFGFLIAFIGQILITGLIHYGYFAIIDKVSRPSAVMSLDHPSLYKESVIVIALLTIVGYILFGVAILRSRMFPRAGAVLLIIGAVLLFSFPFVFGIAFIILGNSIQSPLFEAKTKPAV